MDIELDVESHSWRTKNVLVMDQGRVNACWAFAPTTATAYEVRIYQPQSTVFQGSPQQLIDHCQKEQPDAIVGMSAIEMMGVWSHIKEVGLATHEAYRYVGIKDITRNIPTKIRRITIDDVIVLDHPISPSTVRKILKEHVVVGMVTATAAFQTWSKDLSHVYVDSDHRLPSHTVVIVGFGYVPWTFAGGKRGRLAYYEIHNSYGINWGDKGFARMAWYLVEPLFYIKGARTTIDV